MVKCIEKRGRLNIFSKIRMKKKESCKQKSTYVFCACDCGNFRLIRYSSILSGHTNSCGCIAKEVHSKRRRKHGLSKSKLYKSWKGMMRRCYTLNNKRYKDYGGRGISVYLQWHEFIEFYSWAMNSGYSDGLTIERKDVDLGYNPNNCIWIPLNRQNNNKRNTVYITAFNETKTLMDWANDIRCLTSYRTLRDRYKRIVAWGNFEKVLTTPLLSSEYKDKNIIPKFLAFGEEKTIRSWSKDVRCIVSYSTLRARLYRGWNIEDALVKPKRGI